MKGFMPQRGSSWELRVYLGDDPVTGKQYYATNSVRCGKREAQRVLAEMVTEAERRSLARTTGTVGDLIEAWFAFAAPDFSPKTVKEARGYIDRSLLPTLGSRPLAKLKPSDLDAFYRRLSVNGGAGGRPLKATTVRRIHGDPAPGAQPRREVGMGRRQRSLGHHAAEGRLADDHASRSCRAGTGAAQGEWPAFQASGERSVAQFERTWRCVTVRGANEFNASWELTTQVGREFSLGLTAFVAPTGDAERLGEALAYLNAEAARFVGE